MNKKEKKYVSDNAQLMAEWNWEKNTDLDPTQITFGSTKKAHWKCSKGHEWEAIIGSRRNGVGCPYCANKKVLQGYNDLQTINPKLASEWNHEKNGDLKPTHFTVNSGKKVWWICQKGHEWQTTIAHRNNGRGCPICISERNTSFPEYAFLYYLKKYGLDAIHSYKGQGYELDIYIPSKKIAIEYDGSFWHQNKMHKDLKKNSWCEKDGIKLYRLREELPSLNDSSIDYIIKENQKDLPMAMGKILHEIIGINVDINIERDAINIENMRVHTEKENSLLVVNPKISNEWNYEKNGKLRPENVFANSNKKVWWKCSNGHEWQSSVVHRNSKGRGCPYCAGQKVIIGYNDLKTINPTLAKEWNCEKNVGLTPADVMPNSHKKVWWKCNEGHEWETEVSSRNAGSGCPYCAGRRVIEGETDLKSTNLDLVKEWNYEKNGDLKPEHFSLGSHKKVWWKCQKGHEWQAIISSRSAGSGCPYCSNKKLLKGYNDLQTINPTLAKEWNYEKNEGLSPLDVLPHSGKTVWWKCQKGHEWQATVDTRARGSGCPYCYGRYVLKGETDLQTINPTLAKEWNYEKNNNLTPAEVLHNSGRKVWWKCNNRHEWQATVDTRARGSGCPYCSGRYVVEGKTDLKSTNPDLAKEWNYEKNGDLKPEHFSLGSHKKVWWKCSKGHEWLATIKHRKYGTGCPYCSNKKILPGFNDLAINVPSLVKEWNFEKNYDLLPTNVAPNSNKKVWWKCQNGHEWQATIASRNAGRGCPYCAGKKKYRKGIFFDAFFL